MDAMAKERSELQDALQAAVAEALALRSAVVSTPDPRGAGTPGDWAAPAGAATPGAGAEVEALRLELARAHEALAAADARAVAMRDALAVAEMEAQLQLELAEAAEARAAAAEVRGRRATQTDRPQAGKCGGGAAGLAARCAAPKRAAGPRVVLSLVFP
jgi:hypothetical protein